MALEYKVRDESGGLGAPVTIGSGLKLDEQVASLGEQLAQEKLKGIQKDLIINSLGATVTQLKIEVMALKGGGE